MKGIGVYTYVDVYGDMVRVMSFCYLVSRWVLPAVAPSSPSMLIPEPFTIYSGSIDPLPSSCTGSIVT